MSSIIIILKLDLKYDNYYSTLFGFICEHSLPIISNAGFLPIISILLDVFLCTKGTSDSLNDSYLDRDCEE
jgi:hypothetical protein